MVAPFAGGVNEFVVLIYTSLLFPEPAVKVSVVLVESTAVAVRADA
jgi:hypothetical protein